MRNKNNHYLDFNLHPPLKIFGKKIDEDFDDNSEMHDESADLSILEKEESLKPILLHSLNSFSKKFKELKKIQNNIIENIKDENNNNKFRWQIKNI